jgi:hypothetical protein
MFDDTQILDEVDLGQVAFAYPGTALHFHIVLTDYFAGP